MKRNVLIILIIVLILALIFGGLYYFDITKTIVHYNYPNISYKIEESDSSIKYTIYTRIDEKTVKCIREYIFENDKLIGEKEERHYSNKLQAKKDSKIFKDSGVTIETKGNVNYITYKIASGASKEEILESYKWLEECKKIG